MFKQSLTDSFIVKFYIDPLIKRRYIPLILLFILHSNVWTIRYMHEGFYQVYYNNNNNIFIHTL